jgi:hypothetical protein
MFHGQLMCVAPPQDGEIQQLLAARDQGSGAEGRMHERLNFVAFKYQLLVDMVRSLPHVCPRVQELPAAAGDAPLAVLAPAQAPCCEDG